MTEENNDVSVWRKILPWLDGKVEKIATGIYSCALWLYLQAREYKFITSVLVGFILGLAVIRASIEWGFELWSFLASTVLAFVAVASLTFNFREMRLKVESLTEGIRKARREKAENYRAAERRILSEANHEIEQLQEYLDEVSSKVEEIAKNAEEWTTTFLGDDLKPGEGRILSPVGIVTSVGVPLFLDRDGLVDYVANEVSHVLTELQNRVPILNLDYGLRGEIVNKQDLESMSSDIRCGLEEYPIDTLRYITNSLVYWYRANRKLRAEIVWSEKEDGSNAHAEAKEARRDLWGDGTDIVESRLPQVLLNTKVSFERIRDAIGRLSF